MGQVASKASKARGGRTLRYAQDSAERIQSTQNSRSPLVADSPGPRGVEEIELAEQTGKVSEASSDDLQKDPVLGNFLDQLSGRVTKRPVAEYEGALQPDPITRRERGQNDEMLKGRLNVSLLRDVLEDSQRPKFRKAGIVDVGSLAESYEINPEVLATVLRYNVLPILKEEPGGKVTGSWPENWQPK